MFDNLSLGRILADDTEDNTPASPFHLVWAFFTASSPIKGLSMDGKIVPLESPTSAS